MGKAQARVCLIVVMGALSFAAPVSPRAEEPASPVRAVLEARERQFFYAGDPFPVKISIGNNGDRIVPNPIRSPLLKSFEVRRGDGATLRATGKPDVPEPPRPDKLSPQAGYFVFVDLTKMYPDLLTAGQYSVRWSADGISSDAIVVRMIPKYDPAKEYRARVETDEGTFTIDFFAKTAPIAVKAFVDMSNAGFYDGLTFHKVVPDYYVEGGDPVGDGSGKPPFLYAAELASLPVVAGTVLLKPASPSPPANGSQFMVLLRPEASWTGQATALGQVVDGLDVVRKISKLPSNQQMTKPYFKPIKDVHIRKVTVQERTQSTGP